VLLDSSQKRVIGERTDQREKPSGQQIDEKPAGLQLTAGSKDIKHENLQPLTEQ
jgi:hypothetical protein